MSIVISKKLFILHRLKKLPKLLLLITLFKLNILSSYIILPFNFSSKSMINNINEPKKYFEFYLNNTIYTKLKINNQFINFRLSMEKFPIYISNQIYEKSNKINVTDNKYSLNYINLNEVLLINDSFNLILCQINNSNGNLISNNNFSFFLVNKFLNYSINIEDGEIGLNRVKGNQYMDIEDEKDLKGYLIEENANLIFQLKKQNLINLTLFSINYNKDEEGEIIIGDFPHLYEPEKFNENNLFMNRVTIYTSPPYNWYSRFRELIYNNESIIVNKMFQFSIDHGFIEAPISVKYHFDPFFKKYNDSCNEELINNYYVFYCKKDAIKNFNSISFTFQNQQSYLYGYLNSIKMEFKYNDLFVKDNNNDINYFQIIFGKINDWIFGKPVFKKYRIVFDQDKKMYGIYNYTKNLDDIQKEKESNYDNKENNTKNFIFWIIITILGIIVIVEGFFLIKNIFMKPRNKRANELKDDYDYNSYLNKDNNIIN